ncbi:MAG: BatB protein [Desulfuromonas sp.]|nr:MAG: BatB protein [Desulfuromonas sp.]
MIEFAWPWVFFLLPMPYLVRRFAPPALAGEEAALWVPVLQPFSQARHRRGYQRLPVWMVVLAVLCWMFLVGAAARPQWLGDPVEIPVSGRDLVLAVDLSGSMKTEDFQLGGSKVDRLSALKRVASDFISRRQGDRLGLILFGEQAYVQTPLTFDRTTVATLLEEAVIGLAGEKTAIGDAIGLAVKRLQSGDTDERVLILLTDGANTAGRISPLKGAELAAAKGLKIYTIGIGADEMMVRNLFFERRVNPSVDLDEKTLRKIAELTGGRYFRARDTAGLVGIYSLLDQLEPIEKEVEVFRPVTALYPWPLASALIGFILMLLLQRGYRGRWQA